MTPTSTSKPTVVPPTEVTEKRRRRVFSAEYKRKIVAECDAVREPGGIGAVLRREGLYTSHLVQWRRARDRGELGGPTKRRGPAPKDARDKRIEELEREVARLEKRARRAEGLVELQKKVAEILASTETDASTELDAKP
jgi:transposase-like protein